MTPCNPQPKIWGRGTPNPPGLTTMVVVLLVAIPSQRLSTKIHFVLYEYSGGASPLFVAGQSKVISRIRKCSQHIDIHVRATFYEFSRFKSLLLHQSLNVRNMLKSNQKFHCCKTYKRLLTHAIKLILSHRSNEVE